MSKKRRHRSRKIKDPNAVTVTVQHGSDLQTVLAANELRPDVQAAVAIKAYDKSSGPYTTEADAIVAELEKQIEAINNGDLSRAEAMLVAQAHTLDMLFYGLIRGAAAVNEGSLQHYQTRLHLALKVQSQCRATWQTLVEVKFPRQTQFVRQQNVAVNQQVNSQANTESRAREAASKPANELLETLPNERLECGTASAPSTPNTPLAAVDKINGS